MQMYYRLCTYKKSCTQCTALWVYGNENATINCKKVTIDSKFITLL